MNVFNLADLFRTVARVHGGREAIIDGDRCYTYRELDALVDRTAAHMLAHGVAPGDRIGICLLDNADYLIAMLAAWRIEATAVPMDWRSKGSERQAAADRFAIGLVLEHRPPAEPGRYRRVPLDDGWHQAVAGAAPTAAPAARRGDVAAVINLSSGTTGQPTGMPTSHEAVFARSLLNVVNCGSGAGARYLMTLPLLFGATRDIATGCLLFGGTVIHYSAMFMAADLCKDTRRHAVTHLSLVPNMVRALLDLSSPDGPLLPDLEALLCTGGLLTAEEKHAAAARICPNLFDSYGATSGGAVSFLRPEDIAAHADSVGRPGLHVDVEIVDDHDRPLPAGEPGLLRFSSPATIANQDVADAAAVGTDIVRDGWHYPGDLARMDADGFIYLLGRSADIIIRGGVNIYPVDIENVLTAHPAVAEAAAVGWASPALGEEVAAFVVLGGTATKAELTAWCGRHLGPAKQPRDIFIRDTLPCNTNGKILKRELKAALPPIDE